MLTARKPGPFVNGPRTAPGESSVYCLMAARRENDIARRNWLQLMKDVDHAPQLSGVLLDRTLSGDIERYLATHGWRRERSSLSIVRQSGIAPIREVWRFVSGLQADWLVTLADDDHWEGLTSLSPQRKAHTALVAPSLMITSSTSSCPVRPTGLLPQHALHGALNHNVAQTIAKYLASAPTPWGGEDLLLLFVAQSIGSIVQSSDYTYFWNSRNWEFDTQEAALMGYLVEAGWGHLANLSTYLLCQSLDRVAVTAWSRPHLEASEWRRMVTSAMAQFWPVTSPRNHELFRRMPPIMRASVLASRGLSGLDRLKSIASGSLRGLSTVRQPLSEFENFASGRTLVSDVATIRDRLLPALRAEAPQATYPQIDYWEHCISEVTTQLKVAS